MRADRETQTRREEKKVHREMNGRIKDFLLSKLPTGLGNFVAGHSGEAQRCHMRLEMHKM